MPEKIYIYVLTDPFTKQVRYVGKTFHPKQRLRGHYSSRDATYRTNWIRSLKQRGERPIMIVVEETDTENWSDREKYWIKFYKDEGCNLVNANEGGSGAGIPRSKEQELLELSNYPDETFSRPDWHAWVYGGYRKRSWIEQLQNLFEAKE